MKVVATATNMIRVRKEKPLRREQKGVFKSSVREQGELAEPVDSAYRSVLLASRSALLSIMLALSWNRSVVCALREM